MATTKVDVNLISATGTPGSGNFLRGDGTWQVVSSGMSFISSTDISDAATYDFTAVDASSYDNYVIHTMNLTPATDDVGFELLTSSNGGSSYDTGASDYSWMTQASGVSDDGADDSIMLNGTTAASTYRLGSAAGEDGGSFVIYIAAPHLAKKTLIHWNGAIINSDGLANRAINGSAGRMSSADVDAFRLKFTSGNIESGTVTVYGLANA